MDMHVIHHIISLLMQVQHLIPKAKIPHGGFYELKSCPGDPAGYQIRTAGCTVIKVWNHLVTMRWPVSGN